MPRAVTYCRVSSEEQAAKDISIPAQHKLLKRWVLEQGDVELLQEFEDQGESAYARADKRPGFCSMIAFCRKQDVDLILVHKLDRFSRNREESILFKSLLRRHGVRVQSITEHYDPETPQGFLYEGMIEVINQFYSMNLATETLKGMRENAERGRHNGGRTPYGYRVERTSNGSGREHSRLVPGPDDEVQVIRDIFEMATEQGLGARTIANRLNLRGTRAPRTKHWSRSTIYTILTNRTYVGDQVWNRHGKDKTLNDPSEWITVTDTHEPLISREVFERYAEVAGSRKFNLRRTPKKSVKYLLSRLTVCDRCGEHHFVGRRQTHLLRTGERTEYLRYYCGGYLSKGRSVCQPLGIDKDWLEGEALRHIREQVCTPARLAELERRVRKTIANRRQTYGGSPEAVQRKLDVIEGKIANYYRAIGEGMDITVCQQHIAELEQDKELLKDEAAILGRQSYYELALEKNVAAVRRFGTLFEEKWAELPFDIQRQVLLQFVHKIAVQPDDRIRFELRVPFDNQGVKLLADKVEGAGEPVDAGVETTVDQLSQGSFLRSGPHRGAIYDHRQNSALAGFCLCRSGTSLALPPARADRDDTRLHRVIRRLAALREPREAVDDLQIGPVHLDPPHPGRQERPPLAH
jgi:site-specific DNA recombinase